MDFAIVILALALIAIFGFVSLFYACIYWTISLPLIALVLFALGLPTGAFVALVFWLAGLIRTRPIVVVMNGPEANKEDELGEELEGDVLPSNPQRRRIQRKAWRGSSKRYARKKRLPGQDNEANKTRPGSDA
jgi:hypothetical protein